MYASLDHAIRTAYPQFGVPADRIVSDLRLAQRFSETVHYHLPSTSPQYGLDEVNWRLLTLRKRGQRRGGLPPLGFRRPI